MNIYQQRARIIEDTLAPLIEAAHQAGRASIYDKDDEEGRDEYIEAEVELAEAHGFTKGAIYALVTRSYG